MEPYDFILDAVQKAGDILLRSRDRGFEVAQKGDDPRDIVTSVDTEINEFLIGILKKEFPNDSIYSEEGGTVEGRSAKTWVIDPIDGSANFSRAIPHYAVCLGSLERDTPIMGAVYNPITKELFSFKKGEGAYLNGAPIRVSAITDPSKAHVFLHAGRKPEMWGWGGEAYTRLLRQVNKTKNFSGSALDACFVAAGRIEANIYGTLTNIIDLSPALGILLEAGGVLSDEKGDPISSTVSVKKLYMANNREILDAIRTLLES